MLSQHLNFLNKTATIESPDENMTAGQNIHKHATKLIHTQKLLQVIAGRRGVQIMLKPNCTFKRVNLLRDHTFLFLLASKEPGFKQILPASNVIIYETFNYLL